MRRTLTKNLSLAMAVGIALVGVTLPSRGTAIPQSPGGEEQTIHFSIPKGTILPVRVDQEISLRKAKAGEALTGRIMQNVPLLGGGRIPYGARIRGQIESVTPAANGAAAQIRLRWDELKIGKQTVKLEATVRALASFMEILEAQTPDFTPGFGTPYNWAPTTLVGGGVKYGVGGPVTDEESREVGKGTWNGVLARLQSAPDCPDSGADPERLQALWVFSSDACGVYGVEGVQIAREVNGEESASAPSIVLKFAGPKPRVRAGSGMLLQAVSHEAHRELRQFFTLGRLASLGRLEVKTKQ